LAEIANVKAKKVMGAMSEDMTSKEWKQIAEAIHEELEEADGLVVTMGTDTLGYIAAALSFAIRVDKPVIITAAQKSIDRGSSDSFFNLISAVNAAANWKGKEIAVCMHGTSADEYCQLMRGTKVRKMHSSRRDAFRSINVGILAKVFGAGKIEETGELLPEGKRELFNHFEKDIALVYVHPNIDTKILEACKDKKGVILMGTGLGHIPQKIYDVVKELVDSGVFVGMTTQTLYGRVSPTVYSGLRQVSIGLGVVYLEDMLPETAFVKLSWVLGKTQDMKKVKEMMLHNEVGEINERLDVDEFLA
jgi:glutamyl-tRNA(Gln) amidotransferase subunit D